MSVLLPLLRACEAGSPLTRAAIAQAFSRCSGQQETFWLRGDAQIPFLHLQQLHTSAVAAASTTAAAAPQASGEASAATAAAKASAEAAGPLQHVASDDVLSSVLTGLGSQQMGPQHIGLYYDLNRALLPEAFQAFHQAFYSPRPSKQQRKGGCRALQAELALTHSSSLMWRRASQELLSALSSGAVPALHLRGAAGSGKSLALVQMVEWARSNGWLVLYVPSAGALTRGGFFYKRGDSDTYDTIISAQHILKSMADSHAAQLSALQLQLEPSKQLLAASPTAAAAAVAAAAAGSGSDVVAAAAAAAGESKGEGKKHKKGAAAAAAGDVEGSFMQLVMAGLSTDEDGELAVECCLALIRELAAVSHTQPVLLAVDDYNALYWATEYGRTLFRNPPNRPAYSVRKPLSVEQLNLARNMRLLERTDLGACRVLVADSSSNRVAGDVEVPTGGAAVYQMPRFSEVETAHVLHYYHERGLTAQPPSARQVAAMRALTNGSGTDLRKWCLKVTQTDMGML